MKIYNISVYEGTEYTPHEVFRRSARVLISIILPNDKSNESYLEYATTLFKRIFDVQVSARKNLEKLDLSDATILKQIIPASRYLIRTTIYI